MRRVILRLCLALAFVSAAVAGVAVPAHADSGGGCRQTSNAYVCISVRTGFSKPLIADYYIDNRTRGEHYGYTYVEFYNAGIYYGYFKGVWAPVAGHSPVYTQNKVACCRQARTVVTFRNSGGVYLYTAFSPWQFW